MAGDKARAAREAAEHPQRAAEHVQREYTADAGEDRPQGALLALTGVYVTAVAGIAAAARLTRRPLPVPGPWDVVLLAGATHRLSRLITKDSVTSPLRAPFARFEGTSGPGELQEEVRGRGARKAVGELLTCPFCVGVWTATGLAAGLVFAPRATRLAAGSLTAVAAADLLHFGRAIAQHAAGE
jgi:hypothetical protein